MKKLIITLFALLSIVAGVSSCDKDEQKTNDTTKEVNTDAIEYWLIEIDKCLELRITLIQDILLKVSRHLKA